MTRNFYMGESFDYIKIKYLVNIIIGIGCISISTLLKLKRSYKLVHELLYNQQEFKKKV